MRVHFLSTALASCVRQCIGVRENFCNRSSGPAEVTELAHSGVPHDPEPFDFIGYGDLRPHLEGTVALPAGTKAISQATRR
jgi:hypothetical protein